MKETTPTALDLSNLSRRELQYLARELQLCRANAKSDVILDRVVEFMSANPSDGQQRVTTALEAISNASTKGATTTKSSAKTSTLVKTPSKSPTLSGETSVKSPTSVKVATPVAKTSSPAKTSTSAKAATAPPPVQTAKLDKTPTPKDATPSKLTSSKKAATATKTLTPTKETPPSKPGSSSKPATNPSTMLSLTKSTTPVKSSTSSKSPKPTSRLVLASLENRMSVRTANSVEALVNSVDDLSFTAADKVRCETTGHEMKADLDVVREYINGKRYQRARKQMLSFASYAPMFVDHPDVKQAHMLWCNVTETAIPRDIARIEAHIQAARYQKELPQWQKQEAAKAAEEAAKKQAQEERIRKRKLADQENINEPSRKRRVIASK